MLVVERKLAGNGQTKSMNHHLLSSTYIERYGMVLKYLTTLSRDNKYVSYYILPTTTLPGLYWILPLPFYYQFTVNP